MNTKILLMRKIKKSDLLNALGTLCISVGVLMLFIKGFGFYDTEIEVVIEIFVIGAACFGLKYMPVKDGTKSKGNT